MSPDPLNHVNPNAAVPWILVAGVLTLVVRAGLALVMAGLNRAKNAAHTMAMSLMGTSLAVLGFFGCGYAFMCGAGGAGGDALPIGGPGLIARTAPTQHVLALHIAGRTFNVLGLHGFGLGGTGGEEGAAAAWFVFMAAMIAIAAGIPAGALAERWRFSSLCLFSLVAGAVIHPLLGAWVWGGGWLAQLGVNFGLGHGAVDSGGSAVVHLAGGTAALVGAWMLGPRIGKFDLRGRPKPIFGHHLPMVFIGTLLVGFGWLGANSGAALASGDSHPGIAGTIALNTFLASVGGATAACFYMWYRYGKPDPSLVCSGLIAGLAGVSAGCMFIGPRTAVLIGAVAGVLACWGVIVLERWKIDDPTGVIATHGLGGLWGVLAVGVFANGTAGAGFNGTPGGGVAGLFWGDGRQLLAQGILALTTILWTAGATWVCFKLIGWRLGSNRVTSQAEIGGLDLNEMGIPAYPDFITTFSARNEPADIPKLRRDLEKKEAGAGR